MDSKSNYSSELKKSNHISKTEEPAAWERHLIRNYTTSQSNTLLEGNDITKVLKYPILRRGVLNKLVLRTTMTMLSADGTNHGQWLGLELFNWARLVVRDKIIFEVRPSTLLGIIEDLQQSSFEIIAQACRSEAVAAITNGTTIVAYTPFLFGMFDTIRSLPDMAFLNETYLEVELAPPVSLFTWGGADTAMPTITYELVQQFLDFGVNHSVVMAPRYRSLPWIMYTMDQYQENIVEVAVAANGTQTVPEIVLSCPEDVVRTFIMISSDAAGFHMSPESVETLTIHRNDTLLYSAVGNNPAVAGSISESLLLYHVNRRKDGSLRNYMRPATAQVHMIPWGSRDSDDMIENTIEMGNPGDVFKVNLRFNATQGAGTYSIFISHEYVKRISFDKYGLAHVVSRTPA